VNEKSKIVRPAGSSSVLVSIIDDDESVREALKSLLLSVGFRVEIFPSAWDFLVSDSRDKTSCMIVDIHMPMMTGLELQRQLACERCQIPMIFITAYDDQAVRIQVLKDGAVDFLKKPFNAEALLRAVDAALDRTRDR
jgi:FixJ family two-component response regulator